MSWKDPFVRAETTCPAYVKEATGKYPAVFFRYRRPDPVTIEKQLKDFSDSANDPEKVVESMRKFVALFISAWSFDASCDKEHVYMLGHQILLRIYFVMVGSDPTAEIPKEFLDEGETGTIEGDQKKS